MPFVTLPEEGRNNKMIKEILILRCSTTSKTITNCSSQFLSTPGKFKGGQQNIMNDSKSLLNPKELLELLRSKDHSGEVMNSDSGHVISDSDLELLLDRSDLVAKHKANLAGKGSEMMRPREGEKTAKKAAEKGKDAPATSSGVFKVINDDDEDGGATDLRILTT